MKEFAKSYYSADFIDMLLRKYNLQFDDIGLAYKLNFGVATKTERQYYLITQKKSSLSKKKRKSILRKLNKGA